MGADAISAVQKVLARLRTSSAKSTIRLKTARIRATKAESEATELKQEVTRLRKELERMEQQQMAEHMKIGAFLARREKGLSGR